MKVYMDYAATTPVDPEVINEMMVFFEKKYGNSSSIHSFGQDASDAVEKARGRIANFLGSEEDEIIFTSGGTESDNLAIKGLAYNFKGKRKTDGYHIITSSIEHPAVLQTCKHLEEQGFNVKYISADKYGVVNLEELESSISKDTLLISIMFANNEIGTIQPVEEIGNIAREHDVLFHCDAVQAIGKIPFDVDRYNVDLLSVSSHKIYGPKGCGCLYVRRGLKPVPLLHGGGHEYNFRSGTVNTPGVVGLGKACEIVDEKLEEENERIKKLRDNLIKKVLEIEDCKLNGHPEKRLVNNAHFVFKAIEGESLNMMLDDKGVASATGSACSSSNLEPSHVLKAIGLSAVEAHGSLRLTLGRYTKQEEIEYVAKVLPEVVKRLREMSPLWDK